MRWKTYIILLFGVLILGCNQKKEKTQDSEQTEQTGADDVILEFTYKSLTEKDLAICENQKCPEITVNYLQAKGDNANFDSINKKIRDFVIASLNTEEVAMPDSIEAAAIGFSNQFFEDISRYPTTVAVYSAEVNVKEIYNTPNLVSLELTQYLYTGGAHGNGSISFLNINPKDGSNYNLEDLIKDKREFIRFAEKKFRKDNNIAENKSISSTGFWFENEEFYLPESVGFTIDNLIFIYNDYEISSYAESPIELKISRGEAQPFLKIQ